MKIVVAGALGHIGSRFIQTIPSVFPGAEVVLIDNMLVQRYCSLFNLPDGAKYHFHELAVDASPDPLHTLFQGADVVFHLAAITDAAGSHSIKDQLEKANFGATKNIADTCAALKIPMFFVSTTSVYGTQESQVDENCTLAELKPQSPYAETKLREEAYLTEMGHKQGLRFITCRFGTIFGTSPGMRFHTAVNKFCWQAVMKTPVTVWKTALHQVRPYLDLEDGVRAMHFITQKQLFDRGIYNVLTLNASVADIVEAIRSNVPDLDVQFVESKIMNQLSYHVLNKKFVERGFQFQGSLKRGISDTLRLLRNARTGSVVA